jgi:hypothetical protein
VVDPGNGYPHWVYERYHTAGIRYVVEVGENLNCIGHDEAWVINSLQHTIKPELVLMNARRAAKLVRVFEWTNTVQSKENPHIITRSFLDQVLDIKGTVELLNLFGYTGYCYFGISQGV